LHTIVRIPTISNGTGTEGKLDQYIDGVEPHHVKGMAHALHHLVAEANDLAALEIAADPFNLRSYRMCLARGEYQYALLVHPASGEHVHLLPTYLHRHPLLECRKGKALMQLCKLLSLRESAATGFNGDNRLETVLH
jgi:hypothetical protein